MRKHSNKKNNEETNRTTARDIAFIGMMVAVIEVCKMAFSFLPNIELTSFWLIMFGIYFGRKVLFVVPVFILLEGMVYGFGLWWIMYLYAWPMLVAIVLIFRKKQNILFWSLLSATYGLFFGILCAIPYVVIGMGGTNLQSGLYAGFTWWIAGIPWDIVHCIGNFVVMMVLYTPIGNVLKRIRLAIES